jgi:hypothetical protein
MDEFGFIITRHVNSEETNEYWQESCRCIRKYYPNTPIVIIDDASNQDLVKGVITTNCIVIQSEYPKRGELLPYVYLKKHRWFKKAVIMHDGVFLTGSLKVDDITNVRFLWHFGLSDCHQPDINRLCNIFPEATELRNRFYSGNWLGCFGVQSVITLEFLDTLPLGLLIPHIENREARCALERVFSLLCVLRAPKLYENSSLFGSIFDCQKWGYSFKEYKRDGPSFSLNHRPIKVWTGR